MVDNNLAENKTNLICLQDELLFFNFFLYEDIFVF